MSRATDIEAQQPRRGAPSAAARARALKAARRNTRLVRSLRVLLPTVGVGLISVYAIALNTNLSVADAERKAAPIFTTSGPAITADGVGMRNPRYTGFNKDGSRYIVTAKTAVTDLAAKGPIKLETIDGQLFQTDNTVTRIEATRGTYDQKSRALKLNDGIIVRTSDGVTARLISADVATGAGTIQSNEPVEIELTNGTVWGRRLMIRQKAQRAVLSDGVRARLKANATTQTGTANTGTPQQAGFNLATSGDPNAPIDVSAATLTLNYGGQSARFEDRVSVVQGDTRLTSNALTIDYKRPPTLKPASSPDGLPIAVAPPGASTGGLKSLTASGTVVITQTSRTTRAEKLVYRAGDQAAILSGGVRIDEAGKQTVTAETATLYQRDQRAELSGGVRIVSGPNQSVVASRAALDQKAQTALLTGRVLVTQGRNTLSGERLTADQARGTLSLSNPSGNGRIAARFFRPGAQTRRQAAPRVGNTGANGLNFRTDPNAPILIDAARLDVNDKAKRAVFSGKTQARQGGTTIYAAKLTTAYSGSSAVLAVPGAAPTSQRAPAAGSQIKSLIAERGVRIVSDNGREATGDRMVYNVGSDTIQLTGNVTLKQGRQIVRGTKLAIDVKTGVSKLTATTVSQTGERKRGRMRAVFFPSDFEKARPGQTNRGNRTPRQPAERRQTPTAGSSWSATTQSVQ